MLPLFRRKINELAEAFHPTDCHWDVTRRCNASCDYCFIHDNNAKDLPTNDMLDIADRLSRSGILYLSLSGGEPFIRPDILTILERVIKNDFFWISLFTNGTLITDDHLKFLKANAKYITEIQMSAYSHDPAVNDAYFAIDGALEKILRVGRLLQEAGIHTRIGISIFDFNVNDIKEMRRFFLSHKFSVKFAIMKVLNDRNRDNVAQNNLSYDFYRTVLQNMDGDMLSHMKKNMDNCISGRMRNYNICGGMKHFISVDPEGFVHPCPLMTGIRLGHILYESNIADMLKKSDEYLKIRDLTKHDLPGCSTCSFGGFCSVCIAGRMLENGDYKKPRQQQCNYAKAIHSFCQ